MGAERARDHKISLRLSMTFLALLPEVRRHWLCGIQCERNMNRLTFGTLVHGQAAAPEDLEHRLVYGEHISLESQ